MDGGEEMELVISFIAFSAFYFIFDKLMKKIDLVGNFLKKYNRYRHHRAVLIGVGIIFVYMLELMKYDLNERYGHPNYISLVLAAFIGAVCINFIPVINESKKKDRY